MIAPTLTRISDPYRCEGVDDRGWLVPGAAVCHIYQEIGLLSTSPVLVVMNYWKRWKDYKALHEGNPGAKIQNCWPCLFLLTASVGKARLWVWQWEIRARATYSWGNGASRWTKRHDDYSCCFVTHLLESLQGINPSRAMRGVHTQHGRWYTGTRMRIVMFPWIRGLANQRDLRAKMASKRIVRIIRSTPSLDCSSGGEGYLATALSPYILTPEPWR